MKYALIDSNGFPIAFYADTIHASIPSGAKKISEADWSAHISGNLRRYSGSRWESVPARGPDQVWDAASGGWVDDVVSMSTTARKKRDHLLSESDWTQIADSPLAGDAAWLAYRQALRDVPAQAGFPQTINWPVAP